MSESKCKWLVVIKLSKIKYLFPYMYFYEKIKIHGLECKLKAPLLGGKDKRALVSHSLKWQNMSVNFYYNSIYGATY